MAPIFEVGSNLDPSFFKGTSCAFGVFDGVHEGHRYLLNEACETAAQSGGKSIALTFDRDPDEVFNADTLHKLMSNDERLRQLALSGVDAVAVLPFTPQLAASSPEEFLARTFKDEAPAFLHVGEDFRFGARASGTVEDLREWGAQHGTTVCAHGLLQKDGAPVTATRIRGLLAQGHVAQANRLLGHPYALTGAITAGRGEGASLGFRTANFTSDPALRALGDGVYAAYAYVDGVRYKAAVNVGVAATFADRSIATTEAHLLDFDGNLYGKDVRLEFIEWLRPMRRFDDIDELIATVQGNIEWVRENL